jgi:trans-aconitate methyltransferase
MCGCISVVIKVDGMNELDWLKTTAVYPYLKEKNMNKLFGIAYGVSEIDWAKKTLHLVKEQWNEIIKHSKNTSVVPFLRDIQNIENISYLENTVKNIFG